MTHLMPADARTGVSHEFGVWWCKPPEGVDGPPWPTIVFLHGIQEGGDGSAEKLAKIATGAGLPHEVDRLENELLQDPDRFPFLVVAPQSASMWQEEQEHARVIRLTRRLADHGYLRGRPFLTGFSVGGDGVWRIASQYTSVFAAVAPIASEDPHEADTVASALAKVPLWIGFRDDDNHVERRRPEAVIHALTNAQNLALEVREYSGPPPAGWSAHAYAARQAYADEDFYAWLRDRAECV